jgi:hypothetical protein
MLSETVKTTTTRASHKLTMREIYAILIAHVFPAEDDHKHCRVDWAEEELAGIPGATIVYETTERIAK